MAVVKCFRAKVLRKCLKKYHCRIILKHCANLSDPVYYSRVDHVPDKARACFAHTPLSGAGIGFTQQGFFSITNPVRRGLSAAALDASVHWTCQIPPGGVHSLITFPILSRGKGFLLPTGSPCKTARRPFFGLLRFAPPGYLFSPGYRPGRCVVCLTMAI